MRKAITLAAVATAVVGSAVVAAPASAACPADAGCSTTTVVAVTVVDTGLLSIAATPIAVGTSALSLANSTTSDSGLPVMGGALTLTTVTDTRLNSTGWSVTGSAGDFTATGQTPIPASAVTFTVTTGTKVLGAPTLSYGGSGIANGGTLISAAGSTSGAVVGPNTVTYTPSISVEIPAGSATGTLYTSTVTQSVS